MKNSDQKKNSFQTKSLAFNQWRNFIYSAHWLFNLALWAFCSIIGHDEQCKLHSKEVGLDYSNLSGGQSLLIREGLQRVSGKRINFESEKSSTNNKEVKTLR